MSSAFSHRDVVAVTQATIAGRAADQARLDAARDKTHPAHQYDVCCVCGRYPAPWDGAEFAHPECLADYEGGDTA